MEASLFDAVYNILILVTFVTLVTWRLRFPTTLALILAGVLASVSTRFVFPVIESDIFVSLLLPPILFQETLHLDIDKLIRESDSILVFATLGTILMQLTVALFSNIVLGLNLIESMLFGIILAPTDPVSVIRLFHSCGVDERFQIIVSGESLLNDGVSIVIYSIILTIINQGSISPLIGLQITALTILGGVLLGIIVGYTVHLIFCWTHDTYGQVLISFLVAFGLYRVAEGLGASGVLAIVVSGLLINYRSRKLGGLGHETYVMLENLWEFIGFLASSIAFIFIGMHLDRQVFADSFPISLGLFTVTIVLRVLVIEILSRLMQSFWGKGFSRNWKNGFSWAGIRGAVSIVLVLGLRGVIPSSELIIALTFGVVILSNFIQGTSMGLFVNQWNLLCEPSDDLVSENRFSEDYISDGYAPSKNVCERVFFCAPEYIVRDTTLGSWVSNKLVMIIGYLDRNSIEAFPDKTLSIFKRITNYFTNLLVGFLNWANQYILRRKIEEEESYLDE